MIDNIHVKITWLRNIGNGDIPPVYTAGLCGNYEYKFITTLASDMAEAGITFSDWEYYSGDEYYPVPYPDNKSAPEFAEVAYDSALSTTDTDAFPMYSGEYGWFRQHLAGFIADAFERSLNAEH